MWACLFADDDAVVAFLHAKDPTARDRVRLCVVVAVVVVVVDGVVVVVARAVVVVVVLVVVAETLFFKILSLILSFRDRRCSKVVAGGFQGE